MAIILHIEDETENLIMVENLLTSAGHLVISARDGLEGARLAETRQPDMVLVDTTLPNLDGYEVTLRLRGMELMKNKPIVALSGEQDDETALAVGADGYIKKPINAEIFVSTVEMFLAGHRERANHDISDKLRVRSQKIVERFENKVLELSEANRRLEELARLRNEFLRNLSHEFATPMTPVVGYLRLLLNEEMGPLTPLQRKCLESINTSTQKLRALVDTLLDISGLEMGRLHLYERNYDFAELVEKAVGEITESSAQADISFISEDLSQKLPARGDPDKLSRAMMHILDNAVKFTPRGGEVAVGIRTRKGLTHSDELYQVIVVDNGPGISGEEIEKILEPFHQVDGSPTRSHGGVGLGLAFARHIAEAMGGGIEVQSPPQCSVAGRELGGTAICLTVRRNPVIAQEG
ncbi:MAG: hybrid sensor histidine kinase/response regulator [Deltaproteobacteria bacterium]|nr:hybrid sensor histidine kinase/response regulator [Deltaproteobacteria bacterium]